MPSVENDEVRSPLDVQRTLIFSGVARAGGRVRRGATLYLSGVMEGPLCVESGAQVEISGVFSGALENHGRVVVSGVFQGTVAENDGELLGRAGSMWDQGPRRLVLGPDGSLTQPPPNSSYTVTETTPLCRYVAGSFVPVR